MKTIDHLNFSANKESCGLFIQALEESLFDHSIDSFKAPALSTHSSALEFAVIARQSISGIIKAGAVKPIRDELVHRLKNDIVLKKHKDFTSPIIKALEDQSNSIPRQSKVVQVLVRFLNENYWNDVINHILETIRNETVLGDALIELAHTFVAEADVKGLSRASIYYRAKQVFFSDPPTNQDATRLLIEFIESHRELKLKSFSVIFRGNNSFNRYIKKDDDGIATFGINVTKSLPQKPEGLIEGTGFLRKNPSLDLYLEIKQVSANDAHTARSNADWRISKLADVVALADRRINLRWSSLCAVVDEETNIASVIEPPAQRMRLRNEGALWLDIGWKDLLDFVDKRSIDDQG